MMRPETGAMNKRRHAALMSHARKALVMAIVASLAFVTLSNKAQATGDCVLDATFDGDGKRTSGPGHLNRPSDMAIQPDGKIVVTGLSYNLPGHATFTTVRYNTDGSLDNSFGSGGKTTTGFLNVYETNTVLIQSDGKIIVSGTTFGSDFDYDFSMVRYNTDGSVDNSFGQGGKLIPIINGEDFAHSIALQPDGKLLVSGITKNSRFTLARYNTDGSPDSSFGQGGRIIGSRSYPSSLVLQPDGKIITVGTEAAYQGLYEYNFKLMRYNRDGSLDTAFGRGGKVITDFFNKDDFAWDAVIRPDGKIVVVGMALTGNNNSDPAFRRDADFALARYNSNGTLDTSFDTDGKLTTDFFNDTDEAKAVALQPDGKVVVAGSARNDSGQLFALARYPAESPVSPMLNLVSLTLSASKVPGSQDVTGLVTLCGPAPHSIGVDISSSLAAAHVFSPVLVPAGATTGYFTIQTTPVTGLEAGTVVARLGAAIKSAPLIVRPIGVRYVYVERPTVTGPAMVRGTVGLEYPAPAGGLTVTLSSLNPAVASPTVSRITIPRGQYDWSFKIRVADVSSPRIATIQASANGTRASTQLRVD